MQFDDAIYQSLKTGFEHVLRVAIAKAQQGEDYSREYNTLTKIFNQRVDDSRKLLQQLKKLEAAVKET